MERQTCSRYNIEVPKTVEESKILIKEPEPKQVIGHIFVCEKIIININYK